MKSPRAILASAVASALAMGVATAPAGAEVATEISKPAGAKGAGMVRAGQAKSNQFWWPEQLNLAPLRQHAAESNPMGDDFDYDDEMLD